MQWGESLNHYSPSLDAATATSVFVERHFQKNILRSFTRYETVSTLGILDIQLELNNDAKINIEIQLKQKYNWKKRSVFYLAKMFTADLRRGED